MLKMFIHLSLKIFCLKSPLHGIQPTGCPSLTYPSQLEIRKYSGCQVPWWMTAGVWMISAMGKDPMTLLLLHPPGFWHQCNTLVVHVENEEIGDKLVLNQGCSIFSKFIYFLCHCLSPQERSILECIHLSSHLYGHLKVLI